MQEERIIALLHGPDRAGIVARVSGWIYARGGNILHADQHRDRQEGIFFQRVEWIPVGDIDEEIRLFEELAHKDLDMRTTVMRSSRKPKIALMVSKFEHCFSDIVLRWSLSRNLPEYIAVDFYPPGRALSMAGRRRAAVKKLSIPPCARARNCV